MAGRPRKPTALRILQGNPGRRPLPEGEPISPAGAVCPAWLSPAAKELWREQAPIFERMGCLRVADTLAFANWMILQARIRDGETGAGHPASNEVLRLAQSYAVQFGGTAAGRARVKTEPEKPKAKLDEFTQKRA